MSGRWSVRIVATGAVKASASGQSYVRVVPRPTSARPVSKLNCPSWVPIKGNQTKIYHMPGQAFYSRTTPVVCFSTERAAVQAGYRKSKR
ncbi:hypothetical protein ACQR35_10905 [Pseudarthrobacter sp. J1738]|uniref:sunset domain-containing protein n=1 Tax=unclassified Pseudarthrobacter TaxID=2647000 RepID=UPI003D2BA2E7